VGTLLGHTEEFGDLDKAERPHMLLTLAGLPERLSAALPTATDRSSIRDMQATPRTKPHREIGRLAIGAGLIAFLLPLLPLYGDGSGPFIFS
jgi:hypothetical protein